MILFLKLLLAHILGDFVLQPESWVKNKERNKIKSKKLYMHLLVHAVLLILVLQCNIQYVAAFILIVFSHFLFDIGKIYLQNKNNQRRLFFVDQILHISILMLITYMYEPFSIDFKNIFTEQKVLFVICLLTATHVSSVVIKVIITQWNPENKEKGDVSLAKAGKYIGILERLFVFFFVITANWSGIGFLLGAKSIFRFGDLTASKDRKLTEYVLIGTLLSFGFAMFTGIIFNYFNN